MSLITKSTYLRGPKGDIGLQGPRGERGLSGVPGPQGPQGETAAPASTDDILEGFNNLFFTNQRTDARVTLGINNLINSAPNSLDTLNELAAALNNDSNFGSTVVTSIAGKLSIAGGTMTGSLILNADPTSNLGAATKQYVDQATSNIVTSYNDLTDKPTLFSGSYADLTNPPIIPAAQVQSDWTQANTAALDYIKNKPTLFSGPKGDKGDTGEQGPAGPKGDIGERGLKGDTGDRGLPGAKGDTGERGLKGDTGPEGTTDYNNLLNKPILATVATSGSYTDLTNKPVIPSDINQLNDIDDLLNLGASNWSDIDFDGGTDFESSGSDSEDYGSSELITAGGEFDGDPVGTGTTGEQGPAGPKGDKGDTGEQGLPGADGAQGPKGDTGDTGAKGDTGDTGEQGPKGDTGAQGLPGADGAQGIPGAKGDTGPAGAQGPQGIQGPAGAKGDTGDTGAQGIQGVKGDTGDTGPVAAANLTGTTLASGVTASSLTSVGTLSSLAVSGVSLLGGYSQVTNYYSELGVKYLGAGTQHGITLQPTNDNTTAINFLNAAGTNIGSITQTASTVKFVGDGSQLSKVATQTTGSWTLSPGANTVSLTVPINGTYSIWVRGNIPNGIVTYTATAVVTNTNVPVIGSSYGWYYAAGNALVLTAIPTQFVGTVNTISNAVVSTTTANVFTFGITNNSGASQIVNWGYTTL